MERTHPQDPIVSTYLHVRGELDACSVPKLETMLLNWAGRAGRRLILDVSEADYVDSTALHLFHHMHLQTKAISARLLFRVSPFQRRLLRLVGLDRILALVEPTPGEPVSQGRIEPTSDQSASHGFIYAGSAS
jgi:anti-anti-sigma factor